jgi:hypothetical protein
LPRARSHLLIGRQGREREARLPHAHLGSGEFSKEALCGGARRAVANGHG